MFGRAYQEGMLRTGISTLQSRSDLPREHIFRIQFAVEGFRRGNYSLDMTLSRLSTSDKLIVE